MRIGLQDNTYGVAWNKDGTRIATGGDDGVVRLWDADTFKLHRKLQVRSFYVHVSGARTHAIACVQCKRSSPGLFLIVLTPRSSISDVRQSQSQTCDPSNPPDSAHIQNCHAHCYIPSPSLAAQATQRHRHAQACKKGRPHFSKRKRALCVATSAQSQRTANSEERLPHIYAHTRPCALTMGCIPGVFILCCDMRQADECR